MPTTKKGPHLLRQVSLLDVSIRESNPNNKKKREKTWQDSASGEWQDQRQIRRHGDAWGRRDKATLSKRNEGCVLSKAATMLAAFSCLPQTASLA
ncbi:unnamed protein product [Larinioides sclopetarius]|uniref:Uncharacterized protein n=1 Tax=Larinioides sclopetarius TaxID=280406 RepID=A0AAV2AHI4_9ARAC